MLRGLNLEARQGEALALLGSNGAGKTTLLRILATLTAADSGEVTIDGIDAVKDGASTRLVTGVLMHSPMLYGDLTVEENLLFFCKMFRLDNALPRSGKLLERVEMDTRRDLRVRNLSHGQQKRVALARALLHDPTTLLLDEPESGLDQRAREILDDIINEYRSDGRTVIMTTHELERGLGIADRVAVIDRGKVAFEQERSQFDIESLQSRFGHLMEVGR